jgi:hypothetical protein
MIRGATTSRNGGVVLIISLLLVFVPSPAWAGWADNNCFFNGNGTDMATYKKSQAKSYALVAEKEGYHWGGGCWNDSNTDNQPGDPVQTESTHGEGGDCSGFTFKSWALEKTAGNNGKQKWDRLHYIHGPYTAASFKDPASGWPIENITKTSAYEMEAFASSSHVGMIWNANTSQGQDRIIEAKCEACGTLKALRNYRSDSAYEAARRTGWTPECYPNCQP